MVAGGVLVSGACVMDIGHSCGSSEGTRISLWAERKQPELGEPSSRWTVAVLRSSDVPACARHKFCLFSQFEHRGTRLSVVGDADEENPTGSHYS